MTDQPPRIILATLNAKYIHASLGLRYLLANMSRYAGADLRAVTVLREFTITRPPDEIAQTLLSELADPTESQIQILGLGVYIWNVTQTTELVRLLKRARPELKIVLGGPEVSHECGVQEIVSLADNVITGWGDVSFPKLCRALISGPPPLMKVISGEQPPLDQIALPYAEYSSSDLAHRVLYVEASRGCPFKCEFCLSALDKTAWAFPLDHFLAEIDSLYARGARHFKFVDRTFNLRIEASVRILQFFLDRLKRLEDDEIFLHFEMIPDHLPDRLKDLIAQFPPGVLQLEIGIQSFDPLVQARISRRQDNDLTESNLRWLLEHSHAHLHADLIFGLPGETMAGFSTGFDRLYAIGPHEIQLGILKRLRGAPVVRHSGQFNLVFDPLPPYALKQSDSVSACAMQRFTRIARYWERIANSGSFKQSVRLLLSGSSPFRSFAEFSDWLWEKLAKTNNLSPEQLVDAIFQYLTAVKGMAPEGVRMHLLNDYLASGARASPHSLKGMLHSRHQPRKNARKSLTKRQGRGLFGVPDA